MSATSDGPVEREAARVESREVQGLNSSAARKHPLQALRLGYVKVLKPLDRYESDAVLEPALAVLRAVVGEGDVKHDGVYA